MKKTAKRWSEEEDQVLRDAVAGYKEDEQIGWHDVASNFTDRNNKDCRKRWVYTLAPSIKKGAWAESEDALLLKGIEQHGYKWALVSQVVGSRQPDQCSRRWHESLNPNITHGRWSLPEDQRLSEAVQIYGRRWTEIVERYFPDRTPIAAKNRYTQRFTSVSGTGSPTERSSSQQPQSRERSKTSSVSTESEDVYSQSRQGARWQVADHVQNPSGQLGGRPPGPQYEMMSHGQMGPLQTHGLTSAGPASFSGTALDGFLPQREHPLSAYSRPPAPSIYDSSESSSLDMFSPRAMSIEEMIPSSYTSSVGNLDTHPSGFFNSMEDHNYMGHHMRHSSVASNPSMVMSPGSSHHATHSQEGYSMPQYVPASTVDRGARNPYLDDPARDNYNDYMLNSMQQPHPHSDMSPPGRQGNQGGNASYR